MAWVVVADRVARPNLFGARSVFYLVKMLYLPCAFRDSVGPGAALSYKHDRRARPAAGDGGSELP